MENRGFMKKSILLPFAIVLLLAACTSKEQESQIRLFWLQQYANFMTKQLSQKQKALQQDPRFKNWTETFKNTQSQAAAPGQTVPQNNPAAAKPARPQIMEVTMDTDALPGKASHADRVRMKRALEAVQLSNQKTLSDVAITFGENVKYQAFLLTAQTERQLKKIAAESADFSAYFASQQKLLQEQDRKINELLRNNASSIKKIR